MKRFLLYIFALMVPFFVMAQEFHSLEIDPSSFAPVQTDALTGVAIDKIEPDYSKRPCARIKLHVNRMTRDDINDISVKVIGGNVVVMKRLVAAEGNGLIIELTAKPETRFYLHHDKYGDSNQVSLDLEGNKEYRLSAQLKQLQTVIVSTNVVGAAVYIDDEYKGKTDSSFTLSVKDMSHGTHKLRVEYGGANSEQEVVVDSTNIYFRVTLDTKASAAQYVVFEVNPAHATVIIDGKDCIPDHGVVSLSLHNGTYSYTISAKDYHTQQGEFVVNGAKVERSIKLAPAHGWLRVASTNTLSGANVFVDDELIGTAPLTSDKISSGTHKVKIVKPLYHTFEDTVVIEDGKTLDYAPQLSPNFATVTLTTASGAEIYVNGVRKGTTSWRGDLATGTYVFEARKEHHTTTTITKSIAAKPASQSYVIPSPTPIYGTLDIKSTPALATIYIDNKEVGRTPLKDNVIIGTHRVELRKEGYNTLYKTVEIKEGQTTTLDLTLTEKTTTSSSYTSSHSDSDEEGYYYTVKYYHYDNVTVYVDGEYQGTVGSKIRISNGAHYIVVRNGSNYYGKNVYLGEHSSSVIDMSGAYGVNSPYKTTTSSSSSSSTSSYSSGYNKKGKKGGFNVGITAGLGLEWMAIANDADKSERLDAKMLEFHTGLLWRWWRYNSLFNFTTGAVYMRAHGTNFLNIPMVLRWNVTRDESGGGYLGAGTEYAMSFEYYETYKKVYYDFPVVAQLGYAVRHLDVTLYFKYYIGFNILSTGVAMSVYF